MRIVVLDGYTLNPGDNPWDPIRALGELIVYERSNAQETLERSRDADVLITNKTPLPAPVLAQLPKLKFIAVVATGYNVVDVEAAKQRGIPVANVPEYGTNTVAQFVFALLLELCHHVGEHDRSVHAGEWAANPDFSYWKRPLIELGGKKMGIVGFGRIGRRVGELASAFHMRVLATPGHSKKEKPPYEPFEWREAEQLFAESDVVSLHCPLTPQTQGIVNRARLATMKRSAFLINTARGALVVEPDLRDALNEGVIAGAAVDVVSVEPIRPDNPLLQARNLIITPHNAWATHAARVRVMNTTAQNIAAFQRGKPINVVNP